MNAPTIIIAAIIAVICIFIIVKGVINRKNGKSGCSCGCGGCAMADVCKGNEKKNN